MSRPIPPAPDGLASVVRTFTAADWRETLLFLALIAAAIAATATLILLLEPARP